MILLVVLAFLLVWRFLASSRWPRLDPVRTRAQTLWEAARVYVRSASGTYLYLFVLLITSWVLQTSSPSVAERLVLERSTNLHHLATDPVRVLVASAFWVAAAWQAPLGRAVHVRARAGRALAGHRPAGRSSSLPGTSARRC
jgi:hypothetical protein